MDGRKRENKVASFSPALHPFWNPGVGRVKQGRRAKEEQTKDGGAASSPRSLVNLKLSKLTSSMQPGNLNFMTKVLSWPDFPILKVWLQTRRQEMRQTWKAAYSSWDSIIHPGRVNTKWSGMPMEFLFHWILFNSCRVFFWLSLQGSCTNLFTLVSPGCLV